MSAASTIKMTVRRSEHPMARLQCVTVAPFVNSQAASSGTRVQLTSIGSFQTILPHVAHCFMATKVKGGKGDSLHLHNLLVGCLGAQHDKCSLMSCVNNCSSSETHDEKLTEVGANWRSLPCPSMCTSVVLPALSRPGYMAGLTRRDSQRVRCSGCTSSGG